MHLFLVVLGGRSRGCHIEQHDVRFVAGERIEDTLPELRRQWFGLQRGLHLDSWQRIERVEGWRVVLRPEPFAGPQRLWFVNVGAYDPACPWELHAFGLFVAGGAAAAKAQAKRRLLVGAAQQHKDDSCAVNALPLAGPGAGTLAPSGSTPRPSPQSPPGPADGPTRLETAAAGTLAKETLPAEISTAKASAAGTSAATLAATPTGATAGSHSADTASRRLERAAPDTDEVLALRRLGRWHVHLVPPEPGEDTAWRPLRPDWFGYHRIDRSEPD